MKRSFTESDRLLPTYRWDEKNLSDSEDELRKQTVRLLERCARPEGSKEIDTPPQGLLYPIAFMNVAKRSAAMRQAELLIARGEMQTPPPSLIPTFMASGHAIPGIEDGYMTQDHPSQELFAYNRIGKTSWLNSAFAAHCLTAIRLAHPRGTVTQSDVPTRIKAHAPAKVHPSAKIFENDQWAVVSSKTPIATISENNRTASLISRVTGAVDLTSPRLSDSELNAIVELTEHDIVSTTDTQKVLAQKAIVRDTLLRLDGTDDTPFFPVIQTVYLTQHDTQ